MVGKDNATAIPSGFLRVWPTYRRKCPQCCRNCEGARLMHATGALVDPFPPPIEELARRYFATYPPEVKA